jgi:hypothetical protein
MNSETRKSIMFRSSRGALSVLAPLVFSLTLAACTAGSGNSVGGDAGKQPSSSPVARVSVISYAGPDASGDATVDVRSQSEIVVSGKDSDNLDGPIIQFAWSVADAGGTSLTASDLITLDRASARLTIPRVSAAATVRLRLTITASSGVTDTADATLRIQPVPDSNAFLLAQGAEGRFGIVATTGVGRVASAASAGYRIRVERRIRYRPRAASAAGAKLTNYCANPSSTWPKSAPTDTTQPWVAEPGFDGTTDNTRYINGQWNQGTGTVGLDAGIVQAGSASQNPRYFIAIPSLNADDINRLYRSNGASNVDRQLKPSDIDDAAVDVRITLEPTGSEANVAFVLTDSAGVPLTGSEFTPPNNGSGGPVTLVLDAESLRTALGLETRTAAQAYYCAIDPNSDKLTFANWLSKNGFDPKAENYGADPIGSPANFPHAIYLNNYDLGFGRDMYVKRTPTGCAGADDIKYNVAGVVLNYSSLEAATRKTGAFMAVAMEYALKDPNGDKCSPLNRKTTFYAYVPDDDGDADNDGQIEAQQGFPAYRRVLSANFDGRGEKYIPGSCTSCHGGRPSPIPAPPAAAVYPNQGDLESTFLPWDLESFLYASDSSSPSRADPSFSQKVEDSKLRSDYSLQAQESAFREFNRIAYSTYPNPAIADQSIPVQYPFAGYSAPRQLIEGWYGSGLGGPFRKGFSPVGWPATPVNGVVPSDLYTRVIAQNCRACHLQQVQTSRKSFAGELGPSQFGTFQDFASYLTNPLLQKRIDHRLYAAANMPGSRLTDDRFWLKSGSSAASSSTVLRDALLKLDPSLTVPVTPGSAVLSPTPATTTIACTPAVPQTLNSDKTCVLGARIGVSGTPNYFISPGGLRWSVIRSGSGGCANPSISTPLGADLGTDNSDFFSFSPNLPGVFCVSASVTGAATALRTWTIGVPDAYPVLAASPLSLSASPGATRVFAVSASSPGGALPLLSALGDGNDSAHQLSAIDGTPRTCPFTGLAVTGGTLSCSRPAADSPWLLSLTGTVVQIGTANFSVAISDANGSRAQPSGFVQGTTPSVTSSLQVQVEYVQTPSPSSTRMILSVNGGTADVDEVLPILSNLGLTPYNPTTQTGWRVVVNGQTSRASQAPAYLPPAYRSAAGSIVSALNVPLDAVTYRKPPRVSTSAVGPVYRGTSAQDQIAFPFSVQPFVNGTAGPVTAGYTGVIELRSSVTLASWESPSLWTPCSGCHSATTQAGNLVLGTGNEIANLFGNSIDLSITDLATGYFPSCPGSTGTCRNGAHPLNGAATYLTPAQVSSIKTWLEQGAFEK